MNDRERYFEIRQFYEKAELPEGIVRRLHELESVDARSTNAAIVSSDGVRSRSFLSSLKSILLVAASVLVAFTAGYLTRQNLQKPGENRAVRNRIGLPVVGNSSKNNPILPRVVAVRYHADWCPRCPVVEPIYRDLIEEYGDSPLLFVTLDVSSKNKSRQSRQLMKLLDIEWIENQNLETGSILLVDREKNEILAIVKQMSEQLTFETALVDYLDGAK